MNIDEKIIEAVNSAGYKASVFSEEKASGKEETGANLVREELKEMKNRVIWSFVFLVPLMYVSMGHMIGLPMPSFLIGHENAVSFAMVQLLLTPDCVSKQKVFSGGFQDAVQTVAQYGYIDCNSIRCCLGVWSICNI